MARLMFILSLSTHGFNLVSVFCPLFLGPCLFLLITATHPEDSLPSKCLYQVRQSGVCAAETGEVYFFHQQYSRTCRHFVIFQTFLLESLRQADDSEVVPCNHSHLIGSTTSSIRDSQQILTPPLQTNDTLSFLILSFIKDDRISLASMTRADLTH